MRRTRATRSAALICALLVTAVLFSPVASAHVQSFNATLTLQYKSRTQTFFGTLGTNRTCKDDRLVTLYDADTNSPVASDTTNDNGRYRISFTADGGRYYARVERDVRGGYAHVHRCRGDRSPTIDTSRGDNDDDDDGDNDDDDGDNDDEDGDGGNDDDDGDDNLASTIGTLVSGPVRADQIAPVSYLDWILSMLLVR